MTIQKTTAQQTHSDGTFSDYLTVTFPPTALTFIDVEQGDVAGKLADIAHYRYVKAIERGVTDPIIVTYDLLATDVPVANRFPNCSYQTEQGETLLSANSFISDTMRTLFQYGWIGYQDGRWLLQVPNERPDWRKRATLVLQHLETSNSLYLLSDHQQHLTFREPSFSADQDLVGVGKCSLLSRFVKTVESEFVFNTAYFLLEDEDVISHHSALCEAHSFWMANGIIERPPLFRRGAIWQHKNLGWEIGLLGLDELAIELPNRLRLVHLERVSAETDIPYTLNEGAPSDLIIYTRYFGVASQGRVIGRTPIDPGRFELTVIDRRIVGWKRGGGLTIPHNGLIISFSATALTIEQQTALITILERAFLVNYRFVTPEQQTIQQGLQAGPLLLIDGQSPLTNIYLESAEQFWPSRQLSDGSWQIGVVSTSYKTDVDQNRTGRVGVGVDVDGKLIAVMAPGVNSGMGVAGKDSFGATLLEIAELLKQAGAVDAVNLDGGGSAQAYFQGERAIVPGDRRGKLGHIFERMVPSVGIVR